MLNQIKIPVIIVAFALILPKVSYAWEDQHDRLHHEHDHHWHANPDLTLVTGMDNIDRRVLIASDGDQALQDTDTDQLVTVIETTVPVPVVGVNADGFIVNVPKRSGGYNPVLIKKWGNGYMGPEGELYYPFPDVSQLTATYGI